MERDQDEGEESMDEDLKEDYKAYQSFNNPDTDNSGSESSEEEEEVKIQPKKDEKKSDFDLSNIFHLKSEKDVEKKEYVRKISSDDVLIMAKLIAKYDDNFKVNIYLFGV